MSASMSTRTSTSAKVATRQVAAFVRPCVHKRDSTKAFQPSRKLSMTRATESEAVEVKEIALGAAAAAAAVSTVEDGWVPVCKPEDLPKGVRKEVNVGETSVLMFWYRNQIYCIESRSPAEGAYSEGFIRAKFTQDFCIECPTTASLFSLKDGSIQAWYPNNPVLASLTPANTCRPLEIYPVKLSQEAIYVDITKANARTALGRGGAGTSAENNNVFTVQPTVYFEGQDPTVEAASLYQEGPKTPLNPATVVVAIMAVGLTSVVAVALGLYAFGTQ